MGFFPAYSYHKSEIIRNLEFRTFELGRNYSYHNRIVKFIKVTEKGFNFLDIETSKCILKRHLYSKKYSNTFIPDNITLIERVCILKTITIKEIK